MSDDPAGIQCPECLGTDWKTIETRRVETHGGSVQRRKQCLGCGERLTTFEVPGYILDAYE